MLSAATCFIVALVGFLIFQFAPQIIINLFGSGNDAYNDFAEKTMRIFLSMIMLTGVQMTISNYFSAIGKPTIGIILSLCRQILIFVPLMWILPTFLGLNGVLYAAPISDFTSCALAVILVIKEFQNAGYKKS
jgi:Na+-driven multidrug efflux pump